MDAIVDSDSGEYLGEESLSIRQGIENLIRVLETFRNPLVEWCDDHLVYVPR